MTADSQYDTAVKLVREHKTTSIHQLVIKFGMSYTETANFIERMVKDGILGPIQANGKRVVNPIKKPKPVYSDAQLLGSG